MIDSQCATSRKAVMQNIPSAVRADDGTKMDFKDEIEDEFDDLNTDSVKSEIDGDRISLKSPISKDAFDVVDEFIGDEDNSENINGKESIDTNSDSNGEIDGNEEASQHSRLCRHRAHTRRRFGRVLRRRAVVVERRL